MQKIKFTYFTTSEILPFDIKHTVEYERDSDTPEDINQIFGELHHMLGNLAYAYHYNWELLIDGIETPLRFWVQRFVNVSYGPNRFGEEEYFSWPSFFIKPFLPFTAEEVRAIEATKTDGYVTSARDEDYPIEGVMNDAKYQLGEMWFNLKDYI